MTEREHHPFGPSKWNAWAQCAAFDGKDEVGPAAERGTVQHAALECLLTGTPFTGALDDDELEGIAWAEQCIRATYDAEKRIAARFYHLEPKLESELRVEYHEWDELLYFGTADAVIGNQIYDYKSGRDHGYEPQMYGYAAALCQMRYYDHVMVHLLYGATKHATIKRIDKEVAYAYVEEMIAKRAGKRVPKPCDYCAWCQHAATCPALTERALTVNASGADWQLDNYAAFDIADPNEMAKALMLAHALKAWCASIEDAAHEMAVIRGEAIPGYKVTSRAGARSITDALAAMQFSGLEPHEFIAACSVKIGALEKLLGKKECAEKLAPVITRGENTMSLTKEK